MNDCDDWKPPLIASWSWPTTSAPPLASETPFCSGVAAGLVYLSAPSL